MIPVIALSRQSNWKLQTGATNVTANADEFKRISGLNLENWLG